MRGHVPDAVGKQVDYRLELPEIRRLQAVAMPEIRRTHRVRFRYACRVFARLGTRIAFAHGLLLAAFAAAGSLAFLVSAERALDAEMTARSRAAAQVVAASFDAALLPPLMAGSPTARSLADARLAALAEASEASRVVLLDDSDRVLATSDARLAHGEKHAGLALYGFEAALAHEGSISVSAPYPVGDVWYQAAWVPLGEGALVGLETRVLYRGSLQRLRRGVLAFAALGVASAAAIGLLLARRITDPLAQLSRAMEPSGPGALPRRAGVRGKDEVGRLGERFDALVEVLERHDAELRALSATVAHEVRNPLGAMTGFADLLERRIDQPEMKPLIAGIREEIRILDRLVSRFLSYAGDLRLSFGPSPVGQLLDEALRAAIPSGSSVVVERSFEIPGPTAYADADAMREVFVNLIRNGAQAAGDGGRVQVEARDADNGVDVSVRDDGPGIPEDMRARLFQAFATSKADGTGLGLAISRRIVEGHAGTLRCETGPAGTTFRVWIPRTNAAAHEAHREPSVA